MTQHNPILEAYSSGVGPPSSDLAFEGWMLDRAAAGHPCVFTCSWDEPVVVLGYAQQPEEVDLEWCRSAGVPVLRRLTGGTGVVHHHDLAVSLALPKAHDWARGIVSLYGRFLEVLEAALRAQGGDVRRMAEPRRAGRVRSAICFEDQTSDTLLRDGKKVVGCAQTRRRGAVLIHAAVLLGLDAGLYARVFRVPEGRVDAGLAAAVPDGRWEPVGAEVVAGLAKALRLESRVVDLPELEATRLEPYGTCRWAPVEDERRHVSRDR